MFTLACLVKVISDFNTKIKSRKLQSFPLVFYLLDRSFLAGKVSSVCPSVITVTLRQEFLAVMYRADDRFFFSSNQQ